ncbi:FtsX-like permease family protein [Pleionea sp. CnH1-48]|uniref:ABC transporter permease n=1 Tax=Pleionea sp. CnH1-48 TaxID=2954494 RepID=UPI0020980D0F|nr:FtsX-like permease family protein [Pleionea sp. CnH1-48]MCO7224263.1 ABC transporter permease [Pleionea sp. CnH1-48]
MTLTRLALRSLLDRKGSVALSLMAMTVSIFVLLGVEHIRYQAKENFSNTVSGVDLIVGARTGSLNLLLYSVFRIGSPTNNIRWSTYQSIANNKQVRWAIPISLGDSHKGYRVLGTIPEYFQHFSYGQQRSLTFANGRAFEQVFDVVLGSEVANKLGYRLGDTLTLAHGVAATSFSMHDDRPFTVVGILAPTGTPVDHTLHVSLQGIEAIHIDWHQGVKTSKKPLPLSALEKAKLQPKSVTAIMLGLKSKMATFRIQRTINQYNQEPLSAILPGVALSELWQMISLLENTLLLVSVLVFAAACLGVSAMLLSSIRERRREIQLLRVIGAPPYFLFVLIELEALLMTLLGSLLGLLLLAGSIMLLGDSLVPYFGLNVEVNLLTQNNVYLLGAIIGFSMITALIPSVTGYRQARVIQD